MAEERKLPPDWVVRVSKKRSRKYFFNTKTQESSWDFPTADDSRVLRRKISESDTSDVFVSPTSEKEKSHKRKKPLMSNSEASSVTQPRSSKPRNKHKKVSKYAPSKVDKSNKNNCVAKNHSTLKPVAEVPHTVSSLKHLPRQNSKGKEVRVAQWVSKVNQNFEPSVGETLENDSACDTESVDDFDSVIDKYVHNARVDGNICEPTKATQNDYTPLFQADAHQKHLKHSSESAFKLKNISSVEKRKSPLSNSYQGSGLSRPSTAEGLTVVGQPRTDGQNSSPVLGYCATNTTAHSQNIPVEKSCGVDKSPCNPSPPGSFGGISTSHSMSSKNILTPDTGHVAHTSAPRQLEFRSATQMSNSTSDRTTSGFFKPRETCSITQPVNRVLPSVPMVVDNNPFVNSEHENVFNRSKLLDSPAMNVTPTVGTINHSPGTFTPGCVSNDSGCVSISEEVVGMEIDYSEELEAHIQQELQVVRSEFMVDAAKIQESTSQSQDLATQQLYQDTLYIVLDTNVLLSHLKFVSELKDYPVEGIGRPVLVVPWIVLQELDSLKSDAWKIKQGKIVTPQNKNGVIGIDSLARQAVKFLHTYLESKHPRVRGQTLAEFNEEINTFPDESNDDRILQCCLLFKKKADKGHVVLFSNDRNLCNKALVNGIKAFNHQSLIGGLRELFKSSALVPFTQDSFTEFYSQLRKQEELAAKRAKADDIMCELQCVMREGLSVVMETEMRSAYDKLWETIVFIKPPWTLRDLIQCLNKHWIAVFGHILSRDMKQVVEELKKHFDLEKGVPGCLANVTKILNLAQKLFDSFAEKSSYGGAITKCIAAIMVLQKKCNDYQLGTIQSSTGENSSQHDNVPAIQPTVAGGTEDNTSAGKEFPQNSELSDDYLETGSIGSSVRTKISTSFVHSQPHALVLKTFDVIWNAVTQFSAQIFSALEYPNPIPVNILDNLPRPSRDEAILFLGRLCPCLSAVIVGVQSVLRTPFEKSEEQQQAFEECVRSVRQFLQEILSMESSMTVGDLCVFCQDSSTREGLIKGTSQLDRALATLEHCSSCVASSHFPA